MKNHSDSKTSHNRGFTLIELLVVLVLIGMLAELAIPRTRAKWRKQSIAAKSAHHESKICFLFKRIRPA